MNAFSKTTRWAGYVALVLAASCAFVAQANADDLYVGNGFNGSGGTAPTYYINVNTGSGNVLTAEAGGPIGLGTTSLNGNVLLNPVFCVDLMHDVPVGQDYNNSTVSYTGIVNGSLVNNAGSIAYILNVIAPEAQLLTGADRVDAQDAVQVLIWASEYNSGNYIVSAEPGQNYSSYYNTYLTRLGSNKSNVDTVYWLTPAKNGDGTVYQGLVALDPVPVPAALFFVAPALVGLFGLCRKSA